MWVFCCSWKRSVQGNKWFYSGRGKGGGLRFILGEWRLNWGGGTFSFIAYGVQVVEVKVVLSSIQEERVEGRKEYFVGIPLQLVGRQVFRHYVLYGKMYNNQIWEEQSACQYFRDPLMELLYLGCSYVICWTCLGWLPCRYFWCRSRNFISLFAFLQSLLNWVPSSSSML